MEIRNAKISSTMLGREDHGIMTFMIYIDGGSFACGVGDIVLMNSTLLLGQECSEPSPWKQYPRSWR